MRMFDFDKGKIRVFNTITLAKTRRTNSLTRNFLRKVNIVLRIPENRYRGSCSQEKNRNYSNINETSIY